MGFSLFPCHWGRCLKQGFSVQILSAEHVLKVAKCQAPPLSAAQNVCLKTVRGHDLSESILLCFTRGNGAPTSALMTLARGFEEVSVACVSAQLRPKMVPELGFEGF